MPMDCSNTHMMKVAGTTSGGSEEGESSNSCSRPNRFLELPEDVIRDILRRLGVEDVLENAQRVCSSWRKMCRDDPSMWRVIDMKRLGGEDECLEVMCAEAVDRSQGQLTEIHIDHFATDELLLYISERSRQLRCVRIRNCSGVGDGGLIALAKKCPLLEEMHLAELSDVHNCIEPIGHSCPNLTWFTLSYCHSFRDRDYRGEDFEALAIAKSMPGLRHLGVVGNGMTNEGLEAILDGCPSLESLDIRKCNNVDLLLGEMGDRIARKMKCFKRPDDRMERCEWEAGLCIYHFDSEDYDEEDQYDEQGQGGAYFDSFGYSSDGW